MIPLISFLINQQQAQQKHHAVHGAATKSAAAPSAKYTNQFVFILSIFNLSVLLNQKEPTWHNVK